MAVGARDSLTAAFEQGADPSVRLGVAFGVTPLSARFVDHAIQRRDQGHGRDQPLGEPSTRKCAVFDRNLRSTCKLSRHARLPCLNWDRGVLPSPTPLTPIARRDCHLHDLAQRHPDRTNIGIWSIGGCSRTKRKAECARSNRAMARKWPASRSLVLSAFNPFAVGAISSRHGVRLRAVQLMGCQMTRLCKQPPYSLEKAKLIQRG